MEKQKHKKDKEEEKKTKSKNLLQFNDGERVISIASENSSLSELKKIAKSLLKPRAKPSYFG